MLDQKPYLVRAFYDWIVDSSCTPYLQVMVDYPGVDVPAGYAEDGVMVLNISPSATNQLQLGQTHISFWARFHGKPMGVTVPVESVLAIFAKENGQGMGFPPPVIPEDTLVTVASSVSVDASVAGDASAVPKRDRSHLKVVK
jgi:stringent starvation protein B